MLSLDSPRWSDLIHAYGPATDVPDRLRALASLPDATGQAEPWFWLWSALAHQGDVYSASFAAVPHVVAALATRPADAPAVFFQFPAWIEICRKRNDMAIPDDLSADYFASLAQLPALAAAAAARPWDTGMVSCVLAAIAAAKGDANVAEAALELTPTLAIAFLDWHSER